MKDNQSLHLTIKEPPNPEPVKTLGVFTDLDNPAIKEVIYHYMQSLAAISDTKSDEFIGNVKDEVLKLLSSAKPIAVSRQSNITIVYFEESK
jgi:hypothetical protein